MAHRRKSPILTIFLHSEAQGRIFEAQGRIFKAQGRIRGLRE